jgi:hypothetical protein
MKIRWLLSLALLLSACMPASQQDAEADSPAAEQQPEETPTLNSVEPVEPDVPTATTTPTPADGRELPAVGKVTFTWEPVEGADSYILRFTFPTGDIEDFETDETAKDRYIEAFGMSGEFRWNVTALDVNRNEICVSETALFSKNAIANSSNGGNDNDGNSSVPGSGTGPGYTD